MGVFLLGVSYTDLGDLRPTYRNEPQGKLKI